MENDQTQTERISKKLLAFNGFVVFLIVIMIFVINSSKNQTIVEDNFLEEKIVSHAFENINLEAKSAYVFDVTENKVIFKKNEFLQLPLASITKLMMALIARELIPKDSKIIIKKEFLTIEGDDGLLADESWKLKDLLDFSLLVSSNDGTRSIASVVGAFDLKTKDYNLGRKNFISKMNLRAREIGLRQTYFVNESGLDEEGISGGYGSVIDIAKLMQYILINEPEILEATKYRNVNISSFDGIHKALNTNLFTDKIPGLIASKTGYTSLAGGNLAVAFDASIGRPIIVVVLGSTESGRFNDVSTLVNASLKYISE